MIEVSPFNSYKLLWHRDRISAMLAGHDTPAPINLEWDLSTICPHDCGFCSFGTSESHGYRQQHWQHFPYERAKTLVGELALAGVEAITFTGGGEPLIHPKAADIMHLTMLAGIPFGLVTNGYLLRGRVRELIAGYARFVRVSLDAGTNETHLKMHRPKTSQFEVILDNMQETIQAALAQATRKYPLTVGASFCVTDENWQEIGLCCTKLKAMGANYLEVRPTYPTTWRGDGWGMALSNVSAARAAIEDARDAFQDGEFQIIGMVDRFDSLDKPEKQYRKCQIGPLMTVLGAEGKLWHCCVQRGIPEFEVGNVIGQSFADAWKQAQGKHMADTVDVKKCPRCRYDSANLILAGLESDKMHAGFV